MTDSYRTNHCGHATSDDQSRKMNRGMVHPEDLLHAEQTEARSKFIESPANENG